MGANRLFTTLAVASLALGIGANAAIYSFMDALLLRSLPVAEPDRLALLNWHARIRNKHEFVMYGSHGSAWDEATSGSISGMFPYGAFELFRKDSSIFSSVFAYFHQSRLARRLNLTVQGQAEVASVEYVSGEFFSGLGVPPAAGRLTIPDDDHV